jgi:hypothetical protein
VYRTLNQTMSMSRRRGILAARVIGTALRLRLRLRRVRALAGFARIGQKSPHEDVANQPRRDYDPSP